MALEKDITELVHSSDRLTEAVAGQIDAIDSRVKQAQSEADELIANARSEQQFYRLNKNQALTGTSGAIPDFWQSGNGVTYTKVQEIKAGIEWEDRTPLEQELLTAMGREGEKYVYKTFNIWRMDWVASSHTHLLYQQVNAATPATVAAMTKLLSGKIIGSWADNATDQWTLSGLHLGLVPYRYHHMHPYRQSGEGSMLFCLPAAVAGYHSLKAEHWGVFPYIGDEQNA